MSNPIVLEPGDPAQPLTRGEKADLLRYASGIAWMKSDASEVRGHAERLEVHLFACCATYGQQQSMLVAMGQAFSNRPGGSLPYHGDLNEFLSDAQELYAFMEGTAIA